MKVLVRSDEPLELRPPGSWKPLETDDERVSATVVCPTPRCETPISLENFTISILGEVNPRVQCPRCGWTEHLVLDTWGLHNRYRN